VGCARGVAPLGAVLRGMASRVDTDVAEDYKPAHATLRVAFIAIYGNDPDPMAPRLWDTQASPLMAAIRPF
jgi:hypothetical protein